MSQKYVKPAPGARVITPEGGLIPDEGQYVPATSYFARLLADGDLVEAEPPTKPSEPRQRSNRA